MLYTLMVNAIIYIFLYKFVHTSLSFSTVTSTSVVVRAQQLMGPCPSNTLPRHFDSPTSHNFAEPSLLTKQNFMCFVYHIAFTSFTFITYSNNISYHLLHIIIIYQYTTGVFQLLNLVLCISMVD